jgi:hypothetical protein
MADDPYSVPIYAAGGGGRYPFYLQPHASSVYTPGKIDPRNLKTIEALAMSPESSFTSDSPASSPSCSPVSPVNQVIQRRILDSRMQPQLGARTLLPSGQDSLRGLGADGRKSASKSKPSKKKLEMFKSWSVPVLSVGWVLMACSNSKTL